MNARQRRKAARALYARANAMTFAEAAQRIAAYTPQVVASLERLAGSLLGPRINPNDEIRRQLGPTGKENPDEHR